VTEARQHGQPPPTFAHDTPTAIQRGAAQMSDEKDRGTDSTAQDLQGKAKEAVGKVTGDESLERQGKTDQAKSDLKKAGEKVKDAFKH
jgi:uncharacterized protein YjbJ (UPF0337 family)